MFGSLLVLTGCDAKPPMGVERVVILPATVLSADPRIDWLNLGLALVLEEDLSTSKRYAIAIARDESAARQSGATAVVEIRADVGQRERRFHATLRDLVTQQNRDIFQTSGEGSFVGAMDALAKHLDDAAVSFSTRNDGALQTYTTAVLAADPNERLATFRAVVQQEPSFGLAYLALLQTLDQQRQSTMSIYAAAEIHKSAFTQLDRAQFDLAAKRATAAPVAEQLSAAKTLIALTPNSAQARQSLGELQFATHDANSAARTLAGVTPKTAQVLANRAICALVSGDHAGADQIARNYVKLLEDSHDPLAPLAETAWISISQSPAKATEYLQGLRTLATGDLKAITLAQVSVFQAYQKRFNEARATSAEADRLAQSAFAKLLTVNAALISQSDKNPAQWQQDVQRSPLSAEAKQWTSGYGFFISGRYTESASSWESLLAGGKRADPRVQTMLAAAKHERATASPWFFPNLTGGDQLAFLSFQEMLATTSPAK